MLKIVGAFLVFAGALGIGNSISKRLKQHYHQLIALKELLLLMGNEMRYLKTPLPQALKRIAGQCEAPFGEVLIQTADELLKGLEKGIAEQPLRLPAVGGGIPDFYRGRKHFRAVQHLYAKRGSCVVYGAGAI